MEDFKLDGFFTESCIEWPGQAFSLKVKKELYHQKSAYQDVKVIERYLSVFCTTDIVILHYW